MLDYAATWQHLGTDDRYAAFFPETPGIEEVEALLMAGREIRSVLIPNLKFTKIMLDDSEESSPMRPRELGAGQGPTYRRNPARFADDGPRFTFEKFKKKKATRR
jgi:hypothetical protein